MTRSLALLTVLLLPACVATDPDAGLYRFADCDEMSDYMVAMAKQEVLWDYRWNPGGGVPFAGAERSQSLDDGSAPEDDSGGASSFSETNLQEEGVDEADLVKTDGTWLYALAGGQLVVSRAWPYAEAAQVAQVRLDGTPEGIYLYGDLVVAVGSVWDTPEPRSGHDPTPYTDRGRTLVTVVDVSEPTAPVVIRETYAVGRLVESRRVDNRLYVVTYQDIEVAKDASDAREAERIVRDADPHDWLPWRSDHVLRRGTWEADDDTVCDCADVWASEREGGSWLVTVQSMDLDDPTSRIAGESVVGEAATVYASPTAMYIAASEYSDGPFPSVDGTLQTILHKFDLGTGDAHPSYVATGKALGVVHDRFGLSEYEDVLRIATTEWEGTSSAMVHTLEESSGDFTTLDTLENLGEGEEIYATRFVRDMGYVVTFYQVDPLFTIDLSDPTDIRLGGELEVTGWSDYLHPMDDDHLLSVGMDESGWDWRLAVSLFDVSDIANPKLADRELLDAWGSEAQYESHAFNYF
ncbi:MAG: beta-propeller domain-containing protein, partial [Deltaproteobacteria bacterium]|nr:beta-propeller domain-containing protein [Deltaproteobacteria bacterium]